MLVIVECRGGTPEKTYYRYARKDNDGEYTIHNMTPRRRCDADVTFRCTPAMIISEVGGEVPWLTDRASQYQYLHSLKIPEKGIAQLLGIGYSPMRNWLRKEKQKC